MNSFAFHSPGRMALPGLILLLAGGGLYAEDTLPEPARTVWIIQVEGQEEPIYGFVDDWERSVIRVELDKPWLAEPEVLHLRRSDVVSHGEEWARAREKRLQKEARAAGYDCIDGAFYPSKEVQLARQARLKAQAVADATRDRLPPVAAVPEPAASGPEETAAAAQTPSLVQRWGKQAALAAVAFVLMALVAKTMILA